MVLVSLKSVSTTSIEFFRLQNIKICTSVKPLFSKALPQLRCPGYSTLSNFLFFFFCAACLHLPQSNWQVVLIWTLLRSQCNKQRGPPAPCLCRCGPSHSQMGLSCLPPTASGSEPHRVHVFSHMHRRARKH